MRRFFSDVRSVSLMNFKNFVSYPYIGRHSQRGSALAFLLILLLGIALLAIYANRSAILANRLSRGARDSQIARDAAEAGMADAVNAIAGSQGKVFRTTAYTGYANGQVGSCAAGTADGTGTQAAGGTSTPGLVRFDGCGYTSAWWQTLTLSQIEAIAVPIASITGNATSSYSATGSILAAMPKARSYQAPKALIEIIPDQVAGASAESGSGSAQTFAFRVTTIGYGPTSDSVSLIQETWRAPD